MYADGGHLYVYFVYGMHDCANVVTRAVGRPEAVLLRAAEGPEAAPPRLLAGPARLTRALGITTSLSGLDLLGAGPVRIYLDRTGQRRRIGVAPRVGVDYAGEASFWPLRFYDRDSASVSVRPRVSA